MVSQVSNAKSSKRYCARWSQKEALPKRFIDIPLFEGVIGWDTLSVQANMPIPLSKLDKDLMTIAVTVAYIDRTFRRSACGWSRDINADISVFEIDFWSSQRIVNTLESCLAVLTADAWHIRFHARLSHETEDAKGTPRLDFQEVEQIVPYSGGLDSYAAFHCLQIKTPDTLAVTTKLSSHTDADIKAMPSVLHNWAGAGIKLNAGKHAETTYRSRGFLFLTLAAIIAHGHSANRIVIPETSIGSIGSALTPIGMDYPAHGTYPLFTSMFEDLLSQLWEQSAPRIDHPFLWMTKSQLIRTALDADNSTQIQREIMKTRSCTYEIRYRGVHRKQCGICSNCLLRRSSLFNALPDAACKEQYHWNDLTKPDFEQSLGTPMPISTHGQQVARSGFLIMQSLAEIESNPRLPIEIGKLGHALNSPRDIVRDNVIKLFQQHKQEWDRFLGKSSASNSWIQPLREVA
jgi:7-cyano-7-deazaguanine synthase in queuosine biosynthesis